MLSSAIKLLASLGLVLAGNSAQVGRLSLREQALWHQMEPSLLSIISHGEPVGVAALIDDSGLFVTSHLSARESLVEARTTDGESLTLSVLRRDGPSDLVLLKADHWKAGRAKPFNPPMEEEVQGSQLLAALSTGPIRAEFVSRDHFGVLPTSRRAFPFSEFRFESPTGSVGGALVFCENREIIGVLISTLRRSDGNPNNSLTPFRGSPRPLVPISPVYQRTQIGPSEMTVAYTVGPEVVRRVIEGFRSIDHEVTFPSLGIMCLDNIDGGAFVQTVNVGSSAEKADIRVGDVILDIGGRPIRDQFAFAKVMLQQQVGAKMPMRIIRGRIVMIKDVTIGKHIPQETK